MHDYNTIIGVIGLRNNKVSISGMVLLSEVLFTQDIFRYFLCHAVFALFLFDIFLLLDYFS